jgi:hypothetical protein
MPRCCRRVIEFLLKTLVEIPVANNCLKTAGKLMENLCLLMAVP